MRNNRLAKKLARREAIIKAPSGTDMPSIPKPKSALVADSNKRTDSARSSIESLITDFLIAESSDLPLKSDPPLNEKFLSENFVEILCLVEQLSADELIAIGCDVQSPDVRRLLTMLAAEQDPEKVYADEELALDWDVGREIAGIMAREDPARALGLLPNSKRPEITGSCLQCHGSGKRMRGCQRSYSQEDKWALAKGWGMATGMFSQDAETGLRAYLELSERDLTRWQKNNPSLPLLAVSGSIPLENNQVPEMAAALDKPEFASIRSEIINLTLNDALYEGGVAAMAERPKSLPLTEADLKRYMDAVIGDGSERGGRRLELNVFYTEPEATLQWVSEVRSEEDQRKMIPKMVTDWAKRDSEAVVNWLNEQEASPVRDQTIASLVTISPNVDPGSALQWAREIQDKTLREQTLQEIPGN